MRNYKFIIFAENVNHMSAKEKYTELLAECSSKPLSSYGEDLDKYCELCNLCISLSKENLQEMDRPWETTEMARVFLHYAKWLSEFAHKLNYLYSATSAMLDCVFDHPRLKVKLLNLLLGVLRDLEAQTMHDLSITEDVEKELRFYQRNIEFADQGRLDQIRESGHLKSDPVEWTARWEEVIDEADRIAYSNLADMPRGMGFCHAFWPERTAALAQFGIEWKSPRRMNPLVLFD